MTKVRLLQHVQHCGGDAPDPDEPSTYEVGAVVDIAPAQIVANRLVVDEAAAVSAHTNSAITLPGRAEVYAMRLMVGGWELAELVDGELVARMQSEPCGWQRELDNCRTRDGGPCPPPS